MKKTPLFVLLALFIAASCSKNNTPNRMIPPIPGQPAGTPVPNLAKVEGFLLKACDIKLIPGGEYRIDYTWNTDSSLARYQSRIAGASDATDVDFHYSQNQLSRITTENSIYVGEYHFENGIVKRLSSRNTTIPTGRNYYFGYHADSSVQTLTYKNFNEAGEHLQQTVRYQYAADKRLAEIINTQPNGHKRVIRITKWSEPFYFSPWIFSSSHWTRRTMNCSTCRSSSVWTGCQQNSQCIM